MLTNIQLNDPNFVECIRPLLVEAGSNDVVDFKAWANRLSKRYEIVKLAEGSFGEVFKLRKRSTSITAAKDLDAHGGVIFKVVPLQAESMSGSKDHYATSIDGIVRESKVLKTMAVVPGFTGFRQLHVVQGKYPDSFLEAFYDFKEAGNDCDNDDPQRFSSDQIFAVIEMDDAGTDLDSLRQPSVFQIYDIFWSVVVILANSEEKVEFEHRDLHVGNICIKSWEVGGAIDIAGELVSNMSAAPTSLLGLSGIRSTIIDYTLSRAAQDPEKTDVIFDPFKDATLFKARSKKPEEKRQYNTYRSMHRCVLAAEHEVRGTGPSPKKKRKQVDMWSRFVPKTNVAWLGYILHVLLLRANGRIISESSEVAEQLQLRMYSWLKDAMKMLDVEEEKLPTSAKDLLEVAEASQWLNGEDLIGLKERLEAEAE
jgi:serine/threonine-protein kinase haspin